MVYADMYVVYAVKSAHFVVKLKHVLAFLNLLQF
jgi:hypothetical protein